MDIYRSNNHIRFIIITALPQEPACQVQRLRQEICRVSGSTHALQYPPHITLRTGACVPKDRVEKYITGLGETIKDCPPFPVRTRDIFLGYYQKDEISPICALSIEDNPALLELNQRLLAYSAFRKSDRRAFWPHISLAYGDLREADLQRIRDYLQSRPALIHSKLQWTCDHVGLYLKKDARWIPFHIYNLE